MIVKYSSPPVAVVADFVAKDGFLKLEGAIEPHILKLLKHDFEQVLGPAPFSGVSPFEMNRGRAAVINLYELEESLPATREFFTSNWMQEFSNNFWSEQARLNSEIYVMYELPGTQHIAQDLHFDVQQTLKFFLYLNDVTATNGAFCCIPGSHKKTEEIRLKHGSKLTYENRHLTRQLDYNKDQVLPIEGKAGDLIIFNTDVWHRAGIVKEGERKVMRGHTRPRM